MRKLLLVSFVFALVFGLASCTSKVEKDPPNTIRIPSLVKIKGLDPAFADDLYSGLMSAQAYEGLLQYHYLKRPYTLVPNLAESMPQVSADGKVLTIKIKKGVLFQDDPCFKSTGGKGRELTAEDVVYTYKRLADPKLRSPGWWVFDGKIVGLNEWRDEMSKANATDYLKVVEGLKSLDRYTVQITLKARNAQFLFSFAMPQTYVVPSEAVEAYGKDFINHAVGTGPFYLGPGSNLSSKIIWLRNPTYRKETYPSEGEPGDDAKGLLADAGKALPLTDKLIIQAIEEDQPRWLNFMAGKFDYSGIPKDNYGQAIGSTKEISDELKAKGISLSKNVETDVVHITFNMADPLIGKNKYLRQALSLAYDSTQLIDLFYNGRAVAAQGPIPPGLAGYDPNFKNPYREFNVAKAKELLAKAGYPDGKGLPTLELIAQSSSTDRQFTEFEQKMWDAIGVKVHVNTYSWPEFTASLKNRKGQLWSFAWGGDYPDAENFLQLFYSKNASPGSNDSNYSNPEYDRLYEKSLTLTDSPERTALYKQMVSILVEDCPWVFMVHRIVYTLSQPWAKNFKRHIFEHNVYKYYRVDPALKK